MFCARKIRSTAVALEASNLRRERERERERNRYLNTYIRRELSHCVRLWIGMVALVLFHRRHKRDTRSSFARPRRIIIRSNSWYHTLRVVFSGSCVGDRDEIIRIRSRFSFHTRMHSPLSLRELSSASFANRPLIHLCSICRIAMREVARSQLEPWVSGRKSLGTISRIGPVVYFFFFFPPFFDRSRPSRYRGFFFSV